MRRHQVELIAALAEGRLEDESEARALIASSPRAKAAYEAQVHALESLKALSGPLEMTESEKSAMQRDIWTVLTAEKSVPATKERNPSALLGYATAGIFVIGGLFVAMNLLGPGSGATASMDMGVRSTTEDGAPSQTPELSSDSVERLSTLADRARTGVLRYTDEIAAAKDDLEKCLEDAGLFGYKPEGAFSDGGMAYVLAVPEESEIGPATPIAMVDRGSCSVVYRDD